MIVNIGIGEAYVRGAQGIVGKEGFSSNDLFELADMLENLNKPGNRGSAIRRLTDLCWALQNDTSAMVVFNTESWEENA